MKAKIGDWVRYHHNGGLVIGVVQYVNMGKSYEADELYDTDLGRTDSDAVLEVRRAK